MNKFLKCVPKKNLESIIKLELHYTTYGSPQWTWSDIWRDKHVKAWNTTCDAMSKHLTNLQKLFVLIKNSRKVHWSLEQDALEPLFQFRRLSTNCKPQTATLTRPPPLRNVEVYFKTYLCPLGGLELQSTSRELHKLFGEAIAQVILGKSKEEAMVEVKEAWAGYSRYHQQLRYFGLND